MLTNIMLEEGCLSVFSFMVFISLCWDVPVIWFLGIVLFSHYPYWWNSSKFLWQCQCIVIVSEDISSSSINFFSTSTFPNSTDPLRPSAIFPLLDFHPGVSSVRFHISRYGDSSIILTFLMGDFKYLSLTNTRV